MELAKQFDHGHHDASIGQNAVQSRQCLEILLAQASILVGDFNV
jgi:hypothetical protein